MVLGRRVLLITAMFALCVGVLLGCGNTDGQPASNGPQGNAEGESAEDGATAGGGVPQGSTAEENPTANLPEEQQEADNGQQGNDAVASAEDGTTAGGDAQQERIEEIGSAAEENPAKNLPKWTNEAPVYAGRSSAQYRQQYQQYSGEPSSKSSANTASYVGMSSSGSLECYTFFYDRSVELRYGGKSALADSGRYQGNAYEGEIIWDSSRSSYVVSEGGNLSINGHPVTRIETCTP
jgi:hypothetical protein